MNGDRQMDTLDRVIVSAIGMMTAVIIVGVVAYAGPILRWQLAMLDRIVALFS